MQISWAAALGLEQRLAETCADAIPVDFMAAERVRDGFRFAFAIKRLLDIVLSALLFLALFPLLLAIMIAIRLDSAGPVLFRQTRLGLGGRPFEILKFRTMTVLENGERIVQAARNDPRVTRIGGFLRRTSFDELPQLINVLKGEMSLVGPRPHARAHDKYYGMLIDNYAGRQAVRPGITGWAQVNGLRGETATPDCMRRRVTCDLWYIQNFSLALDLKILLRTAFEIVRPGNSY